MPKKITPSHLITSNENKTPEEILDAKFERKNPIKKPDKKIIKKLEKLIVQEAPKPEIKIISEIKHEKIVYVIKETSYFKINWFYLKTVLKYSKAFILSPFTKIKQYFLNSSKIEILENDKDDNEKLYEEITSLNKERYEKTLDSDTNRATKEIDKKVKSEMFKIIRSEK